MNTLRSTPNLQRLQQVRRALDEALDERSRINRHIRRLRDAGKMLEGGEVPPLLDDLLGFAPPLERRPPPASELSAPAPALPASPTAPSPGLVGHLGAPLPPGPMPTSSSGAPALPNSVDVGHLQQLSPEQLDNLPYGVVTLDRNGRVVGYNDTESRMVGLPKEAVIGRHFFGEVAPCARVKEFEGRFRELVQQSGGVPVTSFDFVFRFSSGVQQVAILISPARLRGRYHVSMIRR
ncbi:MAG: PAS domain-containing protein [Deltaproteobacteria bacterium]|nr:MAG: PAS domain-containing protein [Deltaproteobacteria bacterium]